MITRVGSEPSGSIPAPYKLIKGTCHSKICAVSAHSEKEWRNKHLSYAALIGLIMVSNGIKTLRLFCLKGSKRINVLEVP